MKPSLSSTPAGESLLVRFFSGAASDLRHALRQLGKQRGFATVTLLTLALCIGANTAIFSAVYALLLKPLPFPEPDRIVEIYNGYPKTGLPKMSSNVVTYLDYKQNASSFSAYGLWNAGPSMFGEDTAGERLWGARVTADFFDVAGVKPLIGRFFTLDNSRQNEDKVVVLTQSFWTSQFQEDPDVVGKTVRIGGETITIVGVAPRAFESFDARVRFIRPFTWGEQQTNPQSRHSNYVRLYARLKPGVALAQALTEGKMLERRYNESAPAPMLAFIERSGANINISPLQTERVQPQLRTMLFLLQGGVVFVLLIGCVNIANLLLARANGRQSELATRFALGATRGIITRQLLLETLLLTTLGTAIGLGIAWGAVGALNHYRAEMMAATLPFTVDGRVLAFTIGVSVLAALLISVVPILHVLRANLMELIHGSSRGSSGSAGVRALSSTLIVGQVAVAIVLLTGAGLLIHAFVRAVSIEPGFEPNGVITGRIAIPQAHRASDDAARTLRERIEQAMKEVPGVSSVAFSFAVPFQGGLPINALTLAEDTLPSGSAQPGAFVTTVSPQYLETLRLRLVEGRFFEPADMQPGRRVFVVDETFAKRYFPGKSAVGGRFTFGGRPEKDADWPTIIGVVRNVPHNGVEERSGNPFVYSLLSGRPGGMTLFVRSTRPDQEMIDLMREKLRAIDPTIALFDTGTVEHFIHTSFNQRRWIMLLLGIFAGLALFLSALGIYGVLAYDVSQRTREIGVRGAIGATHHQIIGLIMRQGMLKTAFGLVLGLVGAVVLTRVLRQFLETLLLDLSPTDPRAYAAVSVLLLAVAALASYLPARRAAKINPIEALRVE